MPIMWLFFHEFGWCSEISTLIIITGTTITYKYPLLEKRSRPIKYKHGLDLVIEEFAYPMEEYHQVSIRNGVSLLVSHPFHSLVQPDANIWK